ncbi:MAG: hypothetical protein COT15_04270 [Candidatus Diapherotrites archaeon CG08_land_8_20_14_0_20_34_12]|nr:MAG: hypothetical protein COT15_04270 [Candidatus Diapherotrites archaeon CG08_land_8_20_14_0_20_34_12]
MPKVIYTFHATNQLLERQINKTVVEQILLKPDQLITDPKGYLIAQKIIAKNGFKFLYRVIFIRQEDCFKVLTVYRTTKIQKYWVK